jgi:hypothetical protein
MANVKITGGTKVYVKRKPIKAGSSHSGNTGGILNAKMAATVRRRKRKK